jgi:hypothetical protein
MLATGDCTDGALAAGKDGSLRQRQARVVLWDAETCTAARTIEVMVVVIVVVVI